MVKKYICASFLLGFILFVPIHAVESAAIESKSIIPEFFMQIPIPGFSLTSADIISGTAIAKYVGSAHMLLVGFAAVLAVLALTWGGVRWLLSGGESGKIEEAKKVISNALIGLLLALGSYTLLATIGKDYVSFRPLHVEPIGPIRLNLCWADKGKEGTLKFLMTEDIAFMIPSIYPVKASGFSHLIFDKETSKHDMDLHRREPSIHLIHPSLMRLLTAIDAAGFDVTVDTLLSGNVMDCEYKGIKKARDEGRYVSFITKNEGTLIRLAEFIKTKHGEIPMEMVDLDIGLVRPIEKCRLADNPSEIKSAKFDALRERYPKTFFMHMSLIVECESPVVVPPSTTTSPTSPPPATPTPVPPSPPPSTSPPSIPPRIVPIPPLL